MNKFPKIFDIAFLIVILILITLSVFIVVVNISSFPDIYRYIDRTFEGIIFLSLGALIGIRALIKARPFYVPRKAKWPLRYSFLTAAAAFVSGGLYHFEVSPVLGLIVATLIFVFLFLSYKKGEYERQ